MIKFKNMEKNKYYKIEKRFPQKDEYIKCCSINENGYEVKVLGTGEEKSAKKSGEYLDILISSCNIGIINKLIVRKGYLLYPLFIYRLQKREDIGYNHSFNGGIMGYSLILLSDTEEFKLKYQKTQSKYQNNEIDEKDIRKKFNCIYTVNELFDSVKITEEEKLTILTK